MTKCKRLLCLLLALATVVSLFAVSATANAATVDVAEVSANPTSASDFTWDNATVYFLLTDRFNNGNKNNDHSYNRGLNKDGSVASYNNVASFQGGDFAGITEKINAGYFDDLGVDVIWVAGWFEQIHGYVVGDDSKKSWPHYAYHGYYGLDFTEIDKNYGTEAEFKTMIDAAHKKGIRIVLDVVMNHPGYNTIYDMNEYGFGTLYSGWDTNYYNFSSINQNNYHSKIGYQDNAGNWAKWWGSDWIRAGIAGYKEGYGDLQGSQVFLPDFKTESTTSLDIPQILKTKWNKEGTYSAKVNEINSTFSKYNLGSKTVTNYLVAWYAKWVEEYGIDGFRCDTAKHVDKSSWKKLSDTCTQALKNWRKANPGAVGANWDEDFWMTGEHWGHGLGKDDYYSNGFDSMINFSFSADVQGNNANGMKKASNLNQTYATYASQINNDPNFNALTYISSHDTGLCRDDIYYQGSALLLLPGGVQIFYGDETNRPEVNCLIHDHEMRGFMNWGEISSSSSAQSQVLAHWQKVGTFRNNHVAVGAGSHTNLTATSGTAFARNYNKSGVTDKVVCVVGATNNTNVTITLNNTFANGTTLKNTYTGATATVNGGKVTFNSGAHGTILLEEIATATVPTTTPSTPATKPTTPVTKPTTPSTQPTNPIIPGTTVVLGDADLDSKVTIKDATTIQKHIADIEVLAAKNIFAGDVDSSTVLNIKDATIIQKHIADLDVEYPVGTNVKYGNGGGDTPIVTNPTTPVVTNPITNPTVTEPAGDTIDLTQIDGQIIVLANSQYNPPYAHYWTDGGAAGPAWPGEAMTPVTNGFYFTIVSKEANRIIFNNNSGAQTADLTIPGNFAIYDGSSNSWIGYLSDYVDVTKFPASGFDIPGGGGNGGGNGGGSDITPDNEYVYFKDTENWGTAYCHYWSEASGSVWPGDQMESLGNNLYRFKVPADFTGTIYQKCVFNNGNNGKQTGDLTIQFGQAYNCSTGNWESVN